MELVSETASPVDVRVQDVGVPVGIEEQVWVRVTLGGVVVFEGSQAQLRSAPSRATLLRPGAHAELAVTVSLPATGADMVHGRHSELRLRIASPVDRG